MKELNKWVSGWLIVGLVMIFFQIVIGGVTRLTDSGLSITEWSIIQGTLPPLNEKDWQEAFDLYKTHAKKQFESLHADMELGEFKVIYFWEYFHRLWARLMGFVFLIPFAFFWFRGHIPSWLGKRLVVVILLAAAAALLGWIMVASGLNDDKRTWVSAYKLISHLGIATALFCYLFWTWLKGVQPQVTTGNRALYNFGWGVVIILMLQILLGGLMAGMRAGLIHPHWPFFIEGSKLYLALGELGSQNNGLIDYEASISVKALVQVFHRVAAFVLSIGIIWFFVLLKGIKEPRVIKGKYLLVIMLIIQFSLGILTIVNSVGIVPISYGALHQAFALLLFISLLYVVYQLKAGYQH